METGGWAPRRPLVHRSGTVWVGALPAALHRAPSPPQSRYGWTTLQPGGEGKWSPVGWGGSEPPRQDWVSGKILVAEQAPSARHTQAPLSPTTQSLDLVPVCSECTASPWWLPTTAGLLFFRFTDLVTSLKCCGSEQGLYHTPPCLPPCHGFLLLLPPLCSYLLRVNILSWWGPGTAGQPVALGQLVRPPLWNPISGCLKQ